MSTVNLGRVGATKYHAMYKGQCIATNYDDLKDFIGDLKVSYWDLLENNDITIVDMTNAIVATVKMGTQIYDYATDPQNLYALDGFNN